MSKLHTSVEEC